MGVEEEKRAKRFRSERLARWNASRMRREMKTVE